MSLLTHAPVPPALARHEMRTADKMPIHTIDMRKVSMYQRRHSVFSQLGMVYPSMTPHGSDSAAVSTITMQRVSGRGSQQGAQARDSPVASHTACLRLTVQLRFDALIGGGRRHWDLRLHIRRKASRSVFLRLSHRTEHIGAAT